MTYGTIQQKNGKVRGRLHFDSGKTVALSIQENIDFHKKIRIWQDDAVEKYKASLKK